VIRTHSETDGNEYFLRGSNIFQQKRFDSLLLELAQRTLASQDQPAKRTMNSFQPKNYSLYCDCGHNDLKNLHNKHNRIYSIFKQICARLSCTQRFRCQNLQNYSVSMSLKATSKITYQKLRLFYL